MDFIPGPHKPGSVQDQTGYETRTSVKSQGGPCVSGRKEGFGYCRCVRGGGDPINTLKKKSLDDSRRSSRGRLGKGSDTNHQFRWRLASHFGPKIPERGEASSGVHHTGYIVRKMKKVARGPLDRRSQNKDSDRETCAGQLRPLKQGKTEIRAGDLLMRTETPNPEGDQRRERCGISEARKTFIGSPR